MNELLDNYDNIHTTFLGEKRILKNTGLSFDELLALCKKIIFHNPNKIIKKGKNYYLSNDNVIITINSYNYCVITAHLI